jgi:hypothetical protein
MLTGILRTTGATLATLTGILLAVMALAVRTTLAVLPGAGFLVGTFARRQGFIPVAALLLGTLVSIIAGVVLADLFVQQTLNDWVSLTTVTALVSALLLFDLLRRTLQQLGQADFADMLRTELTTSWRLHTHAVFHLIVSEIHLRMELAKLGFERHVRSGDKEPKQTEFHLKRTGYLVAVDMVPLRRIASLLRIVPRKPNLNLYYPGSLAVPALHVPCVTIPEDREVTMEKSLALLLPPGLEEIGEGDTARMDGLVQKAFIPHRGQSPYFNWQTVYSLLLQAVEKRDVMYTKAVLDTFQALLEEHISAFPKFEEQLKALGATPPGPFNLAYGYHFSPPDPQELNLASVALRASRNDTADCLNEILNSLYALACMSFRVNNVGSFRTLLFEFLQSYRATDATTDGDRVSVAAEIMHRLPWLAQVLDQHLFKHEDSLERLEKVRDFSMPYYSLSLHLVRSSSERDDENMFKRAMEDLHHFLRDQIPDDITWLCQNRAPDGTYPGIDFNLHSRPPQQQEAFVRLWRDLHDYRNLIYVVAGAWLTYQIRQNKLEADRTMRFVDTLVQAAPDFLELLYLYALPGMAGMTTGSDNVLGFGDWDWPYSPYPATKSGTDFQRWIEPFYEFLLLKKAAVSTSGGIALDAIRSSQAADHESLKQSLVVIASGDYRLPDEYTGAPWGISTDDVAKGKGRIQRLIDSW